jgi:hypothetical protein
VVYGVQSPILDLLKLTRLDRLLLVAPSQAEAVQKAKA